jgi:nucleoside-diphosphate-sugar epimerase
MVGTFVTPYLSRHHQLRVLDVKPPQHADLVEYVPGSISNPDDVARALDGADSFINLVMRNPQGGSSTEQDLATIINNYEVNTLGLHLLLWTAQGMGIKAGIHTSSMSVHFRDRAWYPAEETVPLDSPSVYGLTKGLGEQICEYFARWFEMRIIALRITGPRAREAYLAERRVALHPGLYVTDEEDLAKAYLSALEVVRIGSARFDAVYVAGDESEAVHNLTKARTLLGWAPQSHRLLEETGFKPAPIQSPPDQ